MHDAVEYDVQRDIKTYLRLTLSEITKACKYFHLASGARDLRQKVSGLTGWRPLRRMQMLGNTSETNDSLCESIGIHMKTCYCIASSHSLHSGS